MNLTWKFSLVILGILGLVGWKPSTNTAYVQSMRDGGGFYARCVPSSADGWKGKTTVYRVRGESDELVDTYDVFSPGGVDLCWSPKAGKIAVLMWNQSYGRNKGDTVELKFFIGGQHLRDYNTQDLQKVGFLGLERGMSASLKVDGCTQVSRTNDYRFVIRSRTQDGSWEPHSFNILDGKLIEKSDGV